MPAKKLKTIPGEVVFNTTVVVEKTFNYSCTFKELKNEFFNKLKNNELDCFSRLVDYEKMIFHRTGIEKQNFAYYFNYEKLLDCYKYSFSEKESYERASLVVIPLNVSWFENKLFDVVKRTYAVFYQDVKQLLSNYDEMIRECFPEYNVIKGILDKTFGNDEPTFVPNYRKNQLAQRESSKSLSIFINKLDKSGDGTFKSIGHKIKKLQSVSMLFSSLDKGRHSISSNVFNKIYLILGDYNVATFYYEINNEFPIGNCYFASDKNYSAKGIKELKRIKKCVTHSFDSYSDMFEYINFNEFLNFNNDYFSVLDKNGETKRIVFVSNKYLEYPSVNNIDLSTLTTYVKNISMFYNLLCVSICYYRSISFESLKKRAELNNLFNNKDQLFERMNWVNDDSCNGNIINKAPIDDAENLFVDYSTIVYGYITTINRLLTMNLEDEYNVQSVFNNHHTRFRSIDIYYSIVSSVIYCSMLLKICSSLRICLNIINSCAVPIIKNAVIKNYISIYNKSLVLYNSSSIFINHEKMEFHNILLKSLSVDLKIRDIKESSKVAWEEVNILNGYIFPLIQLLLAIISYVVVINVSCGFLFWQRFLICLSISIITITIGFIPKIVARLIVNTAKLPSVSKNNLHKSKQ